MMGTLLETGSDERVSDGAGVKADAAAAPSDAASEHASFLTTVLPGMREVFAEKSKAALRRESHAKAMLEKAVLETSFGEKEKFKRVKLLDPACHLTAACWSTFTKWVKAEYKGCRVIRIQCSEEEKKKFKQVRKGKDRVATCTQ